MFIAPNEDQPPNGYQVASTNVAGNVGSFKDLGLRFLSGIVDVEIAQKLNDTPDRAELEQKIRSLEARSSPLGDTLRAVTPLQWGMVAVAGVLTVGLFAGWFR